MPATGRRRRCCRTSPRTTTAAGSNHDRTASPCWRASGCGPRSPSTSADGCCPCYDRQADRQLLYVNPVLQPANLALRNAWFSGGVEWNIGTRGHSPTTMDTLHAASVEGPDGEPMLRLWEWERLRGVVFQVDLWMPPVSRPCCSPTSASATSTTRPTPMYWWTNAAVAVRPDTRVLAPATRAFRTEYPSTLRVATHSGRRRRRRDVSVAPRRRRRLLLRPRAGQRPWIAAVDGDGTGVAHVSTARATRPQAVRVGHGPWWAALAAVALARRR